MTNREAATELANIDILHHMRQGLPLSLLQVEAARQLAAIGQQVVNIVAD